MTKEEAQIGVFVRTKFKVPRGEGFTNVPAEGRIIELRYDKPIEDSDGLIEADHVRIEGPLASNCPPDTVAGWYLDQLEVVPNYDAPLMKALRDES